MAQYPQPPLRIAIDLEMTGPKAGEDAIIEIGAVRFNGDSFDGAPFRTFVQTTRPIPYSVRRLTGIRVEEMREALPLDEALRRLADYIGNAPLVGHNIAADMAFLDAAKLKLRNPLLDTYHLAVTLLPDLKNYSLEALATYLKVGVTRSHRALDDALTTHRVFVKLLARLHALDAETRDDLSRLPASGPWTVRDLLRSMPRVTTASAPASNGFDGLGALLAQQKDVSPRVYQFVGLGQTLTPLFATSDEMRAIAGQAAPLVRPAVAQQAHRLLIEGGALQLDLDNDRIDLISLLAPAVRWAVDTGERVIISAPSPAMMTRLAREITPHAFAAAGVSRAQISVAELGERESYLCLRRWFGGATVADGAAVAPDVTLGLARLTIWLKEVKRGWRGELALPMQQEYAWERARGGTELRDSASNCPYDAEGYCFLTSAQRMAREARVVVTTHKALAAALLGRDTLLPPTTRVIALDPHALEVALRDARTHALRYTFIAPLLSDLYSTTDNDQPGGLLHWAWRALYPTELTREQSWASVVSATKASAESFFGALHVLGHVIAPNLEQRNAPVDDATRRTRNWQDVADAWEELRGALDGMIGLLHAIAAEATAQSPSTTSDSACVAVELLFTARQLEAARDAGDELISPATRNFITWIERPDNSGMDVTTPRGARISGGPVQCDTNLLGVYPNFGDAVRPLTTNGNGLLLAGPGIAAGGDFELPRAHFALPTEARAANFGRDRADQTLLCLPTDVPAPNREHYQEQLNQTLIRLAQELDGRLIVYFASRNSLKAGAQGIRSMLERNGILLLAQGIDGSAQQIWRRFNSERRAVLLGGGGYWTSEIEPVRRSCCIVIPRLPLPAESDPVHQARGARWDDPYERYFLPTAAQRMRIALSRLAWSHEERNAIVLFDRRAHTGDDGHAVLATLPRCQELRAPAHEIVREVSDWIGPA